MWKDLKSGQKLEYLRETLLIRVPFTKRTIALTDKKTFDAIQEGKQQDCSSIRYQLLPPLSKELWEGLQSARPDLAYYSEPLPVIVAMEKVYET